MERRLYCNILIFLTFCIGAVSSATPARRSTVLLFQPDGSSFTARAGGDEFCPLLTTVDGCAIIQEADGSFCYALYDPDGTKRSSGWKVGSAAPQQVITQSRNIPYAVLKGRAARLRGIANDKRAQRAAVTRDRVRPATRAGEQTEKKRAIVILAQYTDVRFQYGREYFEDLVNKSGYSYGGAKGSISDYFKAQVPNGEFELTFDIGPVVTLSHEMAYYGENTTTGNSTSDKRAGEAVAEACRLADNEIDFSRYDIDGDGRIDYLCVFTAGKNEAEGGGDNCIWPHNWYLSAQGINLTLDGKKADGYCIIPELGITDAGRGTWGLTPIGTFCHEFGHALGLFDLYDTDYEGSGGQANPLWSTLSVMDEGCYTDMGRTPPYFCAIDRDILGIGRSEELSPGSYTLENIARNGRYLVANTGNEWEFFLFECRENSGWDRYIGNSGLAIYHIDQSDRKAGYSDTFEKVLTAWERWYYNEVNCRPDDLCAYIVEAVPGSRSIASVFFPYGNARAFTPRTNPAFVSKGGVPSTLAVTNISYSGGKASFRVSEVGDEVAPEVMTVGVETYQDAVILTWEASNPDYADNAFVQWGPTGSTATTVEVAPYEDGRYSLTVEGLNQRATYNFSIWFEAQGVASGVHTEKIITKSYYEEAQPYIYLDYVPRNQDRTFCKGAGFPLRLYNAIGAGSIKWYYNGKEVGTDGSGYFHPDTDGELKAVASFPSGGTVNIVKTVTLK